MDRKALIAIIICGVVMLLYYPFILPLFSPKKEIPTEAAKEEVVLEKPADMKAAAEQPLPVPSTQPVQPQTEVPLQEVAIENELLKMVWSNEGAALKSIKLKQFKDTEAKDILELLKDTYTEYRPLAIDTFAQKTKFHRQRYTILEQSASKIVFTTKLEEGINIIKTINLPSGKYNVNMDIALENNTDTDASLSYNVIASSMITHEGIPSTDMAAVIGLDVGNKRTKLLHTAPKGFPSRNESVGIVWAGSTNKYFATILKPASSDQVASINEQAFDALGMLSNEKADSGDFMVSLQTNKFRIPPHQSVTHSYLYFMGPKKEEVLAQYDTLDALLSYGWLTLISKALLAFLNAVHRVIPNYGISIIILTIIIKAILFPLTRKSQLSMFRMQQLQPMINQMKEKYKHDKQRMGKEQMLLFKKYGANPMSGCLPMLLQLPVFFALFRTLQLSFEMRQAPFLLWVNDLSRPDTLLHFAFSIPFIGNTLNILPLIMTAASFAQMKLTPKAPAADPQAQAQQKMMSFMPIIFAFILYHMPSGLTVYWTTSTVFSIIEGLVIRRSIKKIKIK
ncbi:MAG TPA: membrane protein insertase YidC [Candidatus Wunengus sp. YC60]|uniref:membrane protein insertase YidC n=1 Tax=Candidatus Wunengus sp. YC60 TaxID=3367697 RepID=UPI0040255C34